MIQYIGQRYAVDVAAQLIGAYAAKQPWAIRRFNEIDAYLRKRVKK